MPVLVDTNVLVDILTDDPQWSDWSMQQLERNAEEGLYINSMVFAELCYGCPSTAFVEDVIRTFGLIYQEIPKQALFRASQAFAAYKTNKGNKTSPLPDFFIAAHAETAGYRLLTRDRKRVSTYFPSLNLVSP
jgi:predicted nucleic acid-binding protein